MRSLITATLAASYLLGFAQADDATDAAIESLRQSATNYIEAFNKEDAKGIADLFLPEGEIHTADGQVISGKEAIEARYETLFEGEKSHQAALEVGDVRFVAPGIAVEDGVVHLTHPDGTLSTHSYTALHVAQDDGSWLTARVRDEAGDLAGGHAKLQTLDWLIGDWILEIDESKTYLAFDWSDDGPFIDARSLSEAPNSLDTKATMRIAWDPGKDAFVSWSFDADGGYNTGEWTSTGANAWMIRIQGVTADGESLRATREVKVSPNKQSFTWHSRDMSIDSEVVPDRQLTVVKRPPAPSTEVSE